MSDNYHGNRNASLEDLQDCGGSSNALTLSTVAELPSPSSSSHSLSNHSIITQPGLDQVFGDTVVDPREAIDDAWSFSNPTLTLNQEYSENTPESTTNLLASWQESQVSLLPDYATTTTSFLELLEGDYEGSLLSDEVVIQLSILSPIHLPRLLKSFIEAHQPQSTYSTPLPPPPPLQPPLQPFFIPKQHHPPQPPSKTPAKDTPAPTQPAQNTSPHPEASKNTSAHTQTTVPSTATSARNHTRPKTG
ncbi:hypothetical protein HDU79_008808 [Rhizoclosmatium sp. JEL0117]|nr:hypothetical protein HDU79_008808 [Rhizoclosmatium sp. JEL0117]